MSMPYSYIEGYTMADVAFEATGKTLEEMFESAAMAVTNSMVSEMQAIDRTEKVEITIESKDEEKLLHDFLQEILFYKDAENLVFSGYSVKISRTGKGYSLMAEMTGEQIDMNKHDLVVDVKAVSWHRYKVEKTDVWKAFVILDV
jgi:SHS2 domain-containing protein